MPTTVMRECPACSSVRVTLIPRGYAGKTDTPDQYFICQQCGQMTFEIVSVTQRDLRLYRYEVNALYQRDDRAYVIRRILKVGFDEFLLYLNAVPAEPTPAEAAVDEVSDADGATSVPGQTGK